MWARHACTPLLHPGKDTCPTHPQYAPRRTHHVWQAILGPAAAPKLALLDGALQAAALTACMQDVNTHVHHSALVRSGYVERTKQAAKCATRRPDSVCRPPTYALSPLQLPRTSIP